MKVNFVEEPFQHIPLNCSALNQIIQQVPAKPIDQMLISKSQKFICFKEKMMQEEEKLHAALEKNYFKVSLLSNTA